MTSKYYWVKINDPSRAGFSWVNSSGNTTFYVLNWRKMNENPRIWRIFLVFPDFSSNSVEISNFDIWNFHLWVSKFVCKMSTNHYGGIDTQILILIKMINFNNRNILHLKFWNFHLWVSKMCVKCPQIIMGEKMYKIEIFINDQNFKYNNKREKSQFFWGLGLVILRALPRDDLSFTQANQKKSKSFRFRVRRFTLC